MQLTAQRTAVGGRVGSRRSREQRGLFVERSALLTPGTGTLGRVVQHRHSYSTTTAQATSTDNIRDYDGNFGKRGAAARAASATTQPTPSFETLVSELSPEEARVVRVFRDASSSVVNVNTTASAISLLNPFVVQQVPRGVGSGFIWDHRGHVVTNAHVIAAAAEVSVTLSDGTVAKAKVIGRDREKDVAVLQLQGLSPSQLAGLRPVQLGVSSHLLVGQTVLAAGNPFGLDLTLTKGVVSGLGREIGRAGGLGSPFGPTITNAIQTDAAINPGNSGGPVMDSQGRVVGIATAILDPTGVGISSGVGFAIPIDAVKGLVDQILTHGRVMRPALGISIAPLPQQLLQRLGGAGPEGNGNANANGSGNGASQGGGILVVSVRPGGPADVAGVVGTRRELFGQLMFGDIIIGMNGRPIRQQKDLYAQLDALKVGDTVALELFSGTTRTKRTVRVILADRERLASE